MYGRDIARFYCHGKLSVIFGYTQIAVIFVCISRVVLLSLIYVIFYKSMYIFFVKINPFRLSRSLYNFGVSRYYIFVSVIQTDFPLLSNLRLEIPLFRGYAQIVLGSAKCCALLMHYLQMAKFRLFKIKVTQTCSSLCASAPYLVWFSSSNASLYSAIL